MSYLASAKIGRYDLNFPVTVVKLAIVWYKLNITDE